MIAIATMMMTMWKLSIVLRSSKVFDKSLFKANPNAPLDMISKKR